MYEAGAKLAHKFLFVAACWVAGRHVVVSMLTMDVAGPIMWIVICASRLEAVCLELLNNFGRWIYDVVHDTPPN